jgi:hypothetical protein
MNMKTPTIREEAKKLDRLCREKDEYLEKASQLKEEIDKLRFAGVTGTGLEAAAARYQEILSWLFGLQRQIDEAAANLEFSIDSAGWC